MGEKGTFEDFGQMLSSGTNLSGFGADSAVQYSTIVPSQHFVDTSSSNIMALPQWMYYSCVPQGYVNLLAGSSSGGGYQALPATTSDHKHKNVPIAPMQSWKAVKPSPQMFNSYGWYGAAPEVPNPMLYGQNLSQAWYGMPQLDEELANKLGSGGSQIQIQDGISTIEGSGSRNDSVHQANAAVLELTSKQNCRSKRAATQYDTERRRKRIISERLEALKELLPQSTKGNPAAVLEDIIDYTKYLQLQLKDLSQSRLGGEPISNSLLFIEGYGHYLVREPVVNEPLDEMIGKLLEVNPQDAAEILANKGLYVRDMSLAKGLLQDGA